MSITRRKLLIDWPLLCLSGLTFICCAVPFMVALCINHPRQKRRQKARETARESRIDPPVRALPTSRPRRLTGLDSTHSQQQSKLIARLPAELRLMIWERAVGSKDDADPLHLELGDGGLMSLRCWEPRTYDKLGFRHQCWFAPWSRAQRARLTEQSPDPRVRELHGMISLLLTCKLIYSEAIGILYQSNSFDMRRAATVLRLPQVMLPHRLQQIRRIQFSTAYRCPIRPREQPLSPRLAASDYWETPDEIAFWPAACQVFASLDHLEYLHVTLAIWCPVLRQWHDNDQESLFVALEPLKTVRATEFSVVLTERLPEEVLRRLGPVPFTVYQRERPGRGYTLDESDL